MRIFWCVIFLLCSIARISDEKKPDLEDLVSSQYSSVRLGTVLAMTYWRNHSSTGGLGLSLPTEYHPTTEIIPKPAQHSKTVY